MPGQGEAPLIGPGTELLDRFAGDLDLLGADLHAVLSVAAFHEATQAHECVQPGLALGRIAFDGEENLFVGDRQGTIFKISRSRQIYVFATLEPSIAAYHLTFGPEGYLYVTGPTTSSFDTIHRISPAGEVESYYRGLGRPQGMAFDSEGRLYVAASLGGRRGVVVVLEGMLARLNPRTRATRSATRSRRCSRSRPVGKRS